MPENVTYFRFASGTGQQQSEKGGTIFKHIVFSRRNAEKKSAGELPINR